MFKRIRRKALFSTLLTLTIFLYLPVINKQVLVQQAIVLLQVQVPLPQAQVPPLHQVLVLPLLVLLVVPHHLTMVRQQNKADLFLKTL